MNDLRELRPYLDVLVDRVIEQADEISPRVVPHVGVRRRWPVAVAAALVAAALLVAVIVIRNDSSSVQVPQRRHAPASQPTDSLDGTDDSEPRLPPEPLGPKVVVVEGASGSGTWTFSVYQSTIGFCSELQHGSGTGVGCGALDPQADNAGFFDAGDGFRVVYGTAPQRAVRVRVEYQDGTTLELPAVPNAQFGVSFFAGEVDRDRVVVRVVALDERGTAITEQSIPPMPTRPSMSVPLERERPTSP
jgi:hypothetical protein